MKPTQAERKRDRAVKKHIALYERVSTDKQEFRSQHHALLTYCRRQRWVSPLVYAEKDCRANAKRTVLNELLKDARLGKFEVVVVFKVDRLGSRPLHIYQVVEELRHLKIRFVSINDHIDTSDTSGKTDLLLGFMSTMAGNELHSIRERTKAGLAAARKSGKRLGRPPLNADKIAEVKRQLAQGKTGAEITASTGVSAGMISRIRNDRAKGP